MQGQDFHFMLLDVLKNVRKQKYSASFCEFDITIEISRTLSPVFSNSIFHSSGKKLTDYKRKFLVFDK